MKKRTLLCVELFIGVNREKMGSCVAKDAHNVHEGAGTKLGQSTTS